MNLNSFKNIPLFMYANILRNFKTFSCSGRKYYYFNNMYNHTWANERSVEIPIIMDIINKNKGKTILEVGNVLSHYFSFAHDVLDKYEIFPGVINQDVVDFKSDKLYDLIVSVSTLEHVGWDEPSRDETKILRSIDNLKKLITPDGLIVMTIPIGYNSYLDEYLKNKILTFDKQYFMRKTSNYNDWKEVSCKESYDAKYNIPFSGINSFFIGFIYGLKNPNRSYNQE